MSTAPAALCFFAYIILRLFFAVKNFLYVFCKYIVNKNGDISRFNV